MDFQSTRSVLEDIKQNLKQAAVLNHDERGRKMQINMHSASHQIQRRANDGLKRDLNGGSRAMRHLLLVRVRSRKI